MKTMDVKCPFCGTEKLSGKKCPQCGREAVVLGMESAGCSRNYRAVGEYDSFDAAYEAACKLFDGGREDDFIIDDGWPRLIPSYKLVKEKCPRCGEETRPFEMQRTRDCHGIPFRRVCLNCYDEVMSTDGYDGELYDERDENLGCEY